jgi:hypothetical protein
MMTGVEEVEVEVEEVRGIKYIRPSGERTMPSMVLRLFRTDLR